MLLCDICNSANGSAFAIGQCHVCGGKAGLTGSMIDESAGLLRQEGIATFSISTVIPKDWLTREEDVWDVEMGQSIKNFLNRKISSALEKSTGLAYGSEGDCRVIFDYENGKVSLERNGLFVFGRYKKLVPGLSQSRWLCQKCEGKGCDACKGKGKNYDSVEERIGEPFKSASQADGYVLHASGREDVDATNTGGRPFILEIKNPKKRALDLAAIGKEIAGSREVAAEGLRAVNRAFVEVVTESHFDKTYEAEVEFGRELTGEDIRKIKALQGRSIAQQTPKRVAHRRADLVRHRRIKGIGVSDVKGNAATLTVTAEAGTYIKELISGDGGRTEPSISDILGTSAGCRKLVVTHIDDGFLDFCLGAGGK